MMPCPQSTRAQASARTPSVPMGLLHMLLRGTFASLKSGGLTHTTLMQGVVAMCFGSRATAVDHSALTMMLCGGSTYMTLMQGLVAMLHGVRNTLHVAYNQMCKQFHVSNLVLKKSAIEESRACFYLVLSYMSQHPVPNM